MGFMDFKCPVCGGNVTCEPEIGKRFVSLNFRCDRCENWCDIDITSEAKQAKEDVVEYFTELAERGAE